jgi:hypothetical protein
MDWFSCNEHHVDSLIYCSHLDDWMHMPSNVMRKFQTVPLEFRLTTIALFGIALSINPHATIDRVAVRHQVTDVKRIIEIDSGALSTTSTSKGKRRSRRRSKPRRKTKRR